MNKPKGKTQNPLNNKKNNGFSYSSSSSSSTIPKKPVPNQKGPSFTEGVWEVAVGAGKLAFFAVKTAAIVTAGVVKGIEIAHNQNNEKPKETFSCNFTGRKGISYQGTLHLTDNQIVFSGVPPTRNYTMRELAKAPNPKLEFKIPFQEVLEIKQVNAENPLKRCLQITVVQGSYSFWGVDHYDKAYNHISMGIKPKKPISQLRPNRIN